MKRKNPPPSLRAFTLRLGAMLLVLWLLCMGTFTYGTAQYTMRQLCEGGYDFSETVGMYGQLNSLYDNFDDEFWNKQRSRPGRIEYAMLHGIASAGFGVNSPKGYYYGAVIPSIYDSENIRCQTAVMILDPEGGVIHQSGDFVYFYYSTEETWKQGEMTDDGYGWLDLSDETDTRYDIFRSMYAGTRSLYDIRVLRLTGYFDGSRFEPTAMAFMTDSSYYQALEKIAPEPGIEPDGSVTVEESEDGKSITVTVTGGCTAYDGSYTESQLDMLGAVEWEVRFDDGQTFLEKDLVTIYATSPEISIYEPGGKVRYQGTEEHESLLALLHTMDGYQDSGSARFYGGASKFSLFDSVIFSSYKYYDLSDYDLTANDPFPDADFTVMTAVQGSPLLMAMRYLKYVYVATAAVALAIFFALRGMVKTNLIAPVEAINKGIREGWTHHPWLGGVRLSEWTEAQELVEHYKATQAQLQANKDKIVRLKTALEYAKTAEQNRRQMTSSIAHELKTPLAVIHSYAEGLKEHIAEDKRDKYLDVILAESERMDGMVLEMLDLSRLEAGRVKLSREKFSLADLTKATFERLERAAEAKELQLEFHFFDEGIVVADESRIGQVVENFATNAVKYTPVGGRISVMLERKAPNVVFTIENECSQLSSEALQKVWDTFYRADEARSGGGTGLGLAIAKSIIDLHGGKCAVQNTHRGVAFSFILPC